MKNFTYIVVPTESQQKTLASMFGGTRKIYNMLLGSYEPDKSDYESLLLNSNLIVEQFEYLQDLPVDLIETTVLELSRALDNYRRKVTALPNYRKKQAKQSLAGKDFTLLPDQIIIPWLGNFELDSLISCELPVQYRLVKNRSQHKIILSCQSIYTKSK